MLRSLHHRRDYGRRWRYGAVILIDFNEPDWLDRYFERLWGPEQAWFDLSPGGYRKCKTPYMDFIFWTTVPEEDD